jgi:hypothetical protein
MGFRDALPSSVASRVELSVDAKKPHTCEERTWLLSGLKPPTYGERISRRSELQLRRCEQNANACRG